VKASLTSRNVQFSPIEKAIIDVLANLVADVHPSEAKHYLYLDSNCFLIAFSVTGYCLLQILPSVLVDGGTSLLSHAVYHHCISRMDIALYGR
jgi:hypothetical protein